MIRDCLPGLSLISFKDILILIGLLVFGCSKTSEDQHECGCKSPTLITIPDENSPVNVENQMTGRIFFKHGESHDDFYNYTEYDNRFWIIQTIDGCHNCKRQYFICNEEILSNDIIDLKTSGRYDTLNIKFAGGLKSLCLLKAIPADFDYAEIVLKNIEIL